MVLHTAPWYETLPKPCSLLLDDINEPQGTRIIMKEAADYSGTDDHGTSSDPSVNESASDYGSQHFFSGSRSSGHVMMVNQVKAMIMQTWELMSNRALESWLEEQPGSSNPGMLEQSQVRKSSARISIGDVGKQIKPKSYSLLEPANGNDLKLALFYDGQKLPVKLRPNIGYFVKPLPMDVEAFTDKESRLPGMFEYSRRLFLTGFSWLIYDSCTFTDHIEELNKES
ncbi:hypothetical protein Goklo_029815 [Gossypium klotzschianum]|uniref:Uncharacterized protein n=1 Tax=Gossypium klotzschianum TaxID=34286 RepID=A0A7J8W744_9ROSI|nr:hypothetical protein [Gossypium klotzschianum]